MGMNIKSEKAHRLARQLAAATGLSMTAAVEKALEEAIERQKRDSDYATRKARIREIKKRFGPVPEGLTSDHSDFYDEWGLPK
ncbi:MAG: type II toxin-antitoxin system VapB family antitoxin [Rhizobiaceae bacterium]